MNSLLGNESKHVSDTTPRSAVSDKQKTSYEKAVGNKITKATIWPGANLSLCDISLHLRLPYY